jgi:carbon storage regulator
MFILTRHPGEGIAIGDDIIVTVVAVNRNQARIRITAPRGVQVVREEIYDTMQEENRAAARGLRGPKLLDRVLKYLWGKEANGNR